MHTSQKHRVLVFPAGTEIGLEIFASLKDCKEVELFAAGQNTPNHAQFLYDTYHIIPSVHDESYIDALNTLIDTYDIQFIYPAHDDVIVALARDGNSIKANVLVPSYETCVITRSKSRTYQHLNEAIPVPKRYNSVDEVQTYPVIVKPDKGQGSWGVVRADTPTELRHAIETTDNGIVCEYLPGEEYTVDCFSHRTQGLLFAGARVRTRMRNGIAVSTHTVHLPEAIPYAEAISKHLQLHGAWFFQVKRATDGTLTLLEVAPRIAGSMSTHRMQGVNFAWLTILEAMGSKLSILHNPGTIMVDRALHSRFKHTFNYDKVYIDLDDTILFNNQVHLGAIQLIYQSINQQKQVILLTRHKGNLQETLLRHRLVGLFDSVIHLDTHQKKSEFIEYHDAIFIDDSFAERLDVAQSCNIPTFDLHMLNLLLEGTYDANI
jgi:carbamoyl-phosphate synthase large subunit